MSEQKRTRVTDYHDFKRWCRNHPALDLDPRLHTSGGTIEHGGYISHAKTAAAFAAFRAGMDLAAARTQEAKR